MTDFKIDYLYDIFGQEYLGIDIGLDDKDVNGNTLRQLLDIAHMEIPNFATMNNNLLNRNNDRYHVTVFSVAEYKNKIDGHDTVKNTVIRDIEFVGIGSISIDVRSTYFIVVKSKDVLDLRLQQGLGDKDLHITIGFTHKDLFHNRKNTANIYSLNN